jgi:hypothetical protein
MDDRQVVPVRRFVATVSEAWAQIVAVLAAWSRRAAAAVRSGWVQAIAFLGPHWRRAMAASRSGWLQTMAVLAAWSRRAAAAGRSGWVHTLVHRRARAADVRDRVSQLVKQRSEIDRAEYVGLTDLLEKDERDPQYQ